MTSVAFGFRPVEGITVVGEASREAQPDAVVLFFEVHTAGPGAALACQENLMKARQIAQAVNTVASGRNEVQTGGVTVWPIPPAPLFQIPLMAGLLQALPAFGSPAGSLPMPGMTEGAPVVYEAVSSLKVALRDPNRVGEVVDAVSKVGANVVVGVQFLAQEQESVRRSLLEEAVRETRQIADNLAAAIGRTAGSPISISEETFGAYPPPWGNGMGACRPQEASAVSLSLRNPFAIARGSASRIRSSDREMAVGQWPPRLTAISCSDQELCTKPTGLFLVSTSGWITWPNAASANFNTTSCS